MQTKSRTKSFSKLNIIIQIFSLKINLIPMEFLNKNDSPTEM